MKSLLRGTLRAVWRSLAPWRRPLVRKVEIRLGAFIEATVRPLVAEELERRVHPSLAVVRENIERTEDVVQFVRRSAQENTLLLDSLVRELIRVQLHLEALQRHAHDRDAGDPDGPFATLDDATSGERLMIG